LALDQNGVGTRDWEAFNERGVSQEKGKGNQGERSKGGKEEKKQEVRLLTRVQKI